MATLIQNGTRASRNPSFAGRTAGTTVYKGGGYVFYSDNPEDVGLQDLADAGKFLNRDTVTGAGLVYLWHHNVTGVTINHALLIHNPNSYPITVTSTNYGLTNYKGSPDTEAWKRYFATTSPKSITINPLGYGTLFQQSVPADNNFGMVARTNVTNSSTGAAASALFFDLTWRTNSGGGTAYADTRSPSMRRGKGATYYNTMTFDTIAPTTTDGIAFKILGSAQYPGIFGTDDLPLIVDPAPATSTNKNVTGLLDGGYGQQHAVTMRIKNSFSTARSFNIYMGREAGFHTFPFVNMAGVSLAHNWVPGGTYVDMISTGVINPGQTAEVFFFVVVPAMSTTPLVIGARPV
ncbi:hypothetical protein [Paenibacillus sambharensis]|nr:hypothetical protein [Paenibacillus sambharensis]